MEGLKRGDVVAIALSGDYGKPRPALVVQDDAFAMLDSTTVLLITSDLYESPLVRINLQPAKQNGLRRPSQVMIDKAMTVPSVKLGQYIGHVDDAVMKLVSDALARFLGLAN
jgi:mRNA interferase MazF